MTATVRAGAACALIALPTALAFFTGGFRDDARLTAGVSVGSAHRSFWPMWVWNIAAGTAQPSYPVEKCSESRSPGPSRISPRCCSLMNPLVSSTPEPAQRSCLSFGA